MEMKNIKTVKHRSWNKFISSFPKDLCNGNCLENERFLFRGQGDVNYKLISSFDRQFQETEISERVRKYQRVVSHFTELYRERSDQNASPEAILSAAQHYGLPTRLLDWSSNPFVAAYFAFNFAALQNQRRGSVAIWSIDRRSKLIHQDLGLNVFKAQGNTRASAQQGYFSNLTGLHDNLEEYAEDCTKQSEPLLTRFILPVSEARNAFSYLNSVGFNSFSLFPDTLGLANGALEAEWLEAELI